MRPIPATRLGDSHGLIRAIEQRGRLRTDELVTEFKLDDLFPPGLENALGRMRHFISYARSAGLVKEDRGVVELTDVGRRYIRSADPDAFYDVSPQQAEWLRRQLREKHMTDSIFHGLSIGLSLLTSVPPGSNVSTLDFGRAMAYLGRAGWDNENTLQIQGERHLTLLRDMELIDEDRRVTPAGHELRSELTLPIHMSLLDLASQLNPGGADAVRAAAAAEFGGAAEAEPPPAPSVSQAAPSADAEEEDDNGYHTAIGLGAATAEPSPPPAVPRPSEPPPSLPYDSPDEITPPAPPSASVPPPPAGPPPASPPPPGMPPPVAEPSVPPPAGPPEAEPVAGPGDAAAPPAGLPELPSDETAAGPPASPSAAPPPVAPGGAGAPEAAPAATPPEVGQAEGAAAPPDVTVTEAAGAPAVSPEAAPAAAAPGDAAAEAAGAPEVAAGAPAAAAAEIAPREVAGSVPPPVPAGARDELAGGGFVDARVVRDVAEAAGLRLPAGVYANVVAALAAGRHLLLTGAPGSGKTTLALAVARAAAQAGRAQGATVVTAGPDAASLAAEAGRRGRWLVLDELDRVDVDATLGPLSTFLGGVPVTFAGKEVAPAADWRLAATWSGPLPQATVLRRFAVVEVGAPPEDALRDALRAAAQGDATAAAAAERLLRPANAAPVGAGVLLAAARHAAARNAVAPADPDTLAREAYAAHVAPLLGDAGAELPGDAQP